MFLKYPLNRSCFDLFASLFSSCFDLFPDCRHFTQPVTFLSIFIAQTVRCLGIILLSSLYQISQILFIITNTKFLSPLPRERWNYISHTACFVALTFAVLGRGTKGIVGNMLLTAEVQLYNVIPSDKI